MPGDIDIVQVFFLQGFTAQYGDWVHGLSSAVKVPNAAAIDPESDCRVFFPQTDYQPVMVSRAIDGIQVSDVEYAEMLYGQEGVDDIERITGMTERTVQRPVQTASSLPGMDDLVVLQIENRDDMHMKILVVEYITGGGLVDVSLPSGLLHEGELMLQALLTDLLALKDLEIAVTRDYRLFQVRFAAQQGNPAQIVIHDGDDLLQVLQKLLQQFDAVWPIAPESGNILHNISRLVESAGKTLLNSSAEAVAVAGDKKKTCACLQHHGILTVPCHPFSASEHSAARQWVVKPCDGVGCSDVYLLSDQADFQRLQAIISDHDNYILQPYLQGRTLSLSCLFADGRGWLLSCNEQQIETIDGRFELLACRVNVQADTGACRRLIDRIALAIPGLWGYAGIDLIDSDAGLWVVEINPRLTTSFAGLRDALGINTAQLVLDLLDGTPEISRSCDDSIVIDIAGENCHAS